MAYDPWQFSDSDSSGSSDEMDGVQFHADGDESEQSVDQDSQMSEVSNDEDTTRDDYDDDSMSNYPHDSPSAAPQTYYECTPPRPRPPPSEIGSRISAVPTSLASGTSPSTLSSALGFGASAGPSRLSSFSRRFQPISSSAAVEGCLRSSF